MKGAVIHGPRDVRLEDVPTPKIEKPTDAVIRITATCVCGSDLWPYRGANPITQPTPMRHEYCGVIEEVGKDVSRVAKIDPGKVFDLTLALDQVAEGHRAMDERRAIKTLVRP